MMIWFDCIEGPCQMKSNPKLKTNEIRRYVDVITLWNYCFNSYSIFHLQLFLCVSSYSFFIFVCVCVFFFLNYYSSAFCWFVFVIIFICVHLHFRFCMCLFSSSLLLVLRSSSFSFVTRSAMGSKSKNHQTREKIEEHEW